MNQIFIFLVFILLILLAVLVSSNNNSSKKCIKMGGGLGWPFKKYHVRQQGKINNRVNIRGGANTNMKISFNKDKLFIDGNETSNSQKLESGAFIGTIQDSIFNLHGNGTVTFKISITGENPDKYINITTMVPGSKSNTQQPGINLGTQFIGTFDEKEYINLSLDPMISDSLQIQSINGKRPPEKVLHEEVHHEVVHHDMSAITELQAHIKELEEILGENMEKQKLSDEEIKSLTDELERLNNDKITLTSELEIKTLELARLEAENTDMETNLAALNKEHEANTSLQSSTMQAKDVEHEESKLALSGKITESQVEIDTLTSEIEQLNGNNERLNTNIIELEGSLEQAQQSYSTLQEEIGRLTEEINSNEAILKEYQDGVKLANINLTRIIDSSEYWRQ